MERIPDLKIPDLNPMYNAVVEFIKTHQGEKGYIDTQNDDLDTIYTYAFNYDSNAFEENVVHGVRVVDNEIEVVYEPFTRTYKVVYDEDSFKSEDTEWESIRGGDIAYIPTIFSIAESIWEYVEE